MKSLRLLLISIHATISILLIRRINPISLFNTDSKYDQEKIAALLGHISEFLRIFLSHYSSIYFIWFSDQYGPGVIRATGILLLSELSKMITIVVQYAIGIHPWIPFEFLLGVIDFFIVFIALILTYQLAKKRSNVQKDTLCLQLIEPDIHQNLC